MTTLLERAKKSVVGFSATKHEINDEVIELAVAWAKKKVTSSQVARVMNVSHGNGVYSILARSLAEYVRRQG